MGSELGGAIELHKNPFGWVDGSDEVVVTNCTFNRCVIFETSEVSWHGFKEIKLPGDKKHLSRKLISIYLYTKDRPKEQIAPNHGTFYLPYVPDFTLNKNEKFNEECKRLFVKRDGLLKLAWQQEINLSRHNSQLKSQITKLTESLKPNLCGNALAVKGSVADYYHDQWIGPNFSMIIDPLGAVETITIVGWSPSKTKKRVELIISGDRTDYFVGEGEFTIESKIAIASEPFTIEIRSDINDKVSGDIRDLSLILKYVKVT